MIPKFIIYDMSKTGFFYFEKFLTHAASKLPKVVIVLNHGEGVCADPGKGDATLGVGGPGPPGGDSEHQLSLDRGGEKT
jgi:hypothetical protein